MLRNYDHKIITISSIDSFSPSHITVHLFVKIHHINI